MKNEKIEIKDLGIAKILLQSISRTFFNALQKKIGAAKIDKFELVAVKDKKSYCNIYTDSLEQPSIITPFEGSFEQTVKKFEFALELAEGGPINKNDIIKISVTFLPLTLEKIEILTNKNRLLTFNF